MPVVGRLDGLKPSERKGLEKLLTRKNPAGQMISWENLKSLCALSHALQKVVGILVNRRGETGWVFVGNRKQATFAVEAKLPHHFQGYRFIRTDFHDLSVSDREVAEIRARKLDLLCAVGMSERGLPGAWRIAALDPTDPEGRDVAIRDAEPAVDGFDLREFLSEKKEHKKTKRHFTQRVRDRERAFLVAVELPDATLLTDDLEEMAELVRSLGIEVAGVFRQPKDQIDPKSVVGRGKLDEILDQARDREVTHLLFFQDLAPNQLRLISESTELTVMDRTQVILEIFSRRASSYDGKLQVELARLKYELPRLRERSKDLSRLVGGIGGQGPGEKKLEIHRRRARDRITRLEKEIDSLSLKRAAKRTLRKRRGVPVVSILGYTNAGKSTLLNTLTDARALAENKPFATLDPFSKKIRFPQDRELILTDTVGFIRNLPKDLVTAFRATLEEIGEADLLIHLVDVSYAHFEERIRAVEDILKHLEFDEIPRWIVFNKMDLVTPELIETVCRRYDAIAISAEKPATCRPLVARIQRELWDGEPAAEWAAFAAEE